MGSFDCLIASLTSCASQFGKQQAAQAKAEAKAEAKGKKSAKAKKEVVVATDPWKLNSSEAKKDWRNMATPPLSIFAYVPSPLFLVGLQISDVLAASTASSSTSSLIWSPCSSLRCAPFAPRVAGSSRERLPCATSLRSRRERDLSWDLRVVG